MRGSEDRQSDGTAPRGGWWRRRRTQRTRPDQPCLNCGDPRPGNYCPNCGQAKREVTVSLGPLIMDVLEDQLILSRALPRTLLYLLVHPGFLTAEYIRGRIVRYIAPFRLYLASSVVFFLLLSFFGLRALSDAKLGNVTLNGVTVNTPAGVDSARAVLVARLDSLAVLDTLAMTPAERQGMAANRSAMRAMLSVLPSTAADSSGMGADSMHETTDLETPMADFIGGKQIVHTGNARLDSIGQAHLLERYGALPPRAAFRKFMQDYLNYVPHMVFVLLPVFAFLLKLLYVRQRRYYAEHFVFALHVHAFMFLVFILMFLIGLSTVNLLLGCWILIYWWLAMKRVYRQGMVMTTLKYGALAISYLLILAFASAVTMLVTVLL